MKQVEQAWLDYRKKLLSFIRSKVAVPEDAEEILSDVFSKLIAAADNNKLPTDISSWLYRVSKNRIIDHYRTKRTFLPLPEDLPGELEEHRTVMHLSRCLLPMIYALPPIYQQPLLMSKIEGKTNKAVATELELSLSAVKSRILRGRKKLHKSITDCCTIFQNHAGEIVDYEQKSSSFCNPRKD